MNKPTFVFPPLHAVFLYCTSHICIHMPSLSASLPAFRIALFSPPKLAISFKYSLITHGSSLNFFLAKSLKPFSIVITNPELDSGFQAQLCTSYSEATPFPSLYSVMTLIAAMYGVAFPGVCTAEDKHGATGTGTPPTATGCATRTAHGSSLKRA